MRRAGFSRFTVYLLTLVVILSLQIYPPSLLKISFMGSFGTNLYVNNWADYLLAYSKKESLGSNVGVVLSNSSQDASMDDYKKVTSSHINHIVIVDSSLLLNPKYLCYSAYLAGLIRAPIIIYEPNTSITLSSGTSLFKTVFIVSEDLIACSIVKSEISSRRYVILGDIGQLKGFALRVVKNSNYVVFADESDPDYFALASRYAAEKKAKLYSYNGSMPYQEVNSLFKMILFKEKPEFVALVCPPPVGDRFNLVKGLYNVSTQLDDEKYLDVSIGVLTSVSAESLSNLIENSLHYNSLKGEWKNRALAASIEVGEPLAWKICREYSRTGLEVTLLSNSLEAKNLTPIMVRDWLKRGVKIAYLNMHGNPFGMYGSEQGQVLITPDSIPDMPPSVIVTLSCETCAFDRLNNPSRSIAYSFVGRGAIAYIGATFLEYGGEEYGSSYPEFTIHAINYLGLSLGETVKILNNVYIKKGAAPYHLILIGDPTLCISPHRQEKVAIDEVKKDKEYNIEILAQSPAIFVKLNLSTKVEDYHVIENQSTLYIQTFFFIEKEGEEWKANFFATREISSLGIGDLKPGEVIPIKIGRLSRRMTLLLYILIPVLNGLIITLLILKRKSVKIEKGVAEKDINIPISDLFCLAKNWIENHRDLYFKCRKEITDITDLKPYLEEYYGRKISEEEIEVFLKRFLLDHNLV